MQRIMTAMLAAALLVAIAAPSLAADAIGKVIAKEGKVWAENAEGTRELKLKSPIYVNDDIVTGAEAKMQVLFQDDTVLAQGPDSRVSMDDYVYDPQGESGVNIGMGLGTFRVVTGKIAEQNPENFEMSSPLATIGIRGTMTAHQNTEGFEKHFALDLTGDHVLEVAPIDAPTDIKTIATDNTKVEVSATEGASDPQPATGDEVKAIKATTTSSGSDDTTDNQDSGGGETGGEDLSDTGESSVAETTTEVAAAAEGQQDQQAANEPTAKTDDFTSDEQNDENSDNAEDEAGVVADNGDDDDDAGDDDDADTGDDDTGDDDADTGDDDADTGDDDADTGDDDADTGDTDIAVETGGGEEETTFASLGNFASSVHILDATGAPATFAYFNAQIDEVTDTPGDSTSLFFDGNEGSSSSVTITVQDDGNPAVTQVNNWLAGVNGEAQPLEFIQQGQFTQAGNVIMEWGYWQLEDTSFVFDTGFSQYTLPRVYYVEGQLTSAEDLASLRSSGFTGTYSGGVSGQYYLNDAVTYFDDGSFSSTINFGADTVEDFNIAVNSIGANIQGSGGSLTTDGQFNMNLGGGLTSATLPSGLSSSEAGIFAEVLGGVIGDDGRGVMGVWALDENNQSTDSERLTGVFYGTR